MAIKGTIKFTDLRYNNGQGKKPKSVMTNVKRKGIDNKPFHNLETMLQK